MTHDEIFELLGAYALDAVEPDEAAIVEDHLRDCPRCRAEVAEHRETAALLAHAGADAPPDVWQRISSAIDAPAPVIPLAPRMGFGARRRPLPVVTAAIGVAAALVIAVLGLQLRAQDRRIDDLVASAVPDVTDVVDLRGETASVPVFLDDDGRAWLQASALPALAEGRTYQLWGKAGADLVSIAVLGRDPRVVSFEVEGYSLLAITEEDAPGVVKTANQPLVAAELAGHV